MLGRLAVALLTIVLATPGLAAGSLGPTQDASPLPTPCFVLDATFTNPATGEREERNESLPPEPCDGSRVTFTWTRSAFEGAGLIVIDQRVIRSPNACDVVRLEHNAEVPDPCFAALSASAPRSVDASPLGALRRLLSGWLPREAPSGTRGILRFGADGGGPLLTVDVRVRFHVKWSSSDCGDSRGEFEATLQRQALSTTAPSGFFRSLCSLSTIPSGPDAAGLAARALEEVVRAAPSASPNVDPLVRALRDLATAANAIALPPPPAPEAPDPIGPPRLPEPDASGDALLSAAPLEGEARAAGSLDVGGGLRVAAALAVGAPAPPTDAPAPPAASGTEARVPPLAARAEETPVDAGAGASSPPAAGPREPPPRVVSAQTVASGAPGSAAGGTAVAAAAVVALLALLGIALYQRFARPAALDHPMRSAAYAACLRHERGATAGEVGRALGIGRKSAEYHLLYLARVGLLRADASEGRPRRFAAPSVSPRPAAAPLPERVLDLVRARGEVRLSAIIVALDVKWSRADGCVKTLLLDGRLASRWTSKGRVYRLPS